MPSLFSFKPFQAAAFLWRSRNVPVVPLPREYYPLYEGTPSFVARWALVFVSLDVMYMTSMVYECWEGGQLYHNPLKITRQKQSEDSNASPLSKSEKPLWTRIAFGAFHCGLGGIVAAFILSQRSSWIRSMAIVTSRSKRKPRPSPQLYIEVAGHPRGYAYSFRLQDCSLVNYSSNSNVIMVDAGKEGKFPFYPAGATILRQQMPATGDIGKINMLKIWKEFGGTIQQKK